MFWHKILLISALMFPALFAQTTMPGSIEADTITVYETDFENGTEGWTGENLGNPGQSSDWHLTTSTSASPVTSFAGNDSTTGLYYPDFYQALVSPPISLPADADELELELMYLSALYFTDYQDGDFWWIDISSDGGTTWNMLTSRKLAGGNSSWLKYPDSYFGSETGLISDYAGETIQIRFVLQANDDQFVLSGLFIDDVKIVARFCDSDPLEPNDTPGQAVAIAFGDSISGVSICPTTDNDWFTFTAQEDDFIEIGVASDNVVQLTFYDKDFNVIGYNFWSNVIRHFSEYSGEYFVQISKTYSSLFQTNYTLTLNKLGPNPDVLSVTDIENDSGLQVRVVWKPSFYDAATGNNPTDYYALYREVSGDGSNRPIVSFLTFDEVNLELLESFDNPLIEVGESLWDYVASIPAVSERPFNNYSYVANTLWDDSLTTFVIAAVPKSGYQIPTLWGLPGSGVSTDNQAPGFNNYAIQPVSNGMELSWSVDLQRYPDIAGFNIYRSSSADFAPDATTLLNRLPVESLTYMDERTAAGELRYYIIEVLDISGNAAHTPVLAGTVTSNEETGLPSEYRLSRNYPNPFNPTTSIAYSLPQAGMTTLKVYDITGKEVMTLVNEFSEAGNYSVTFDAASLASGVYLYRLQSGSFNAVNKMMLLK